MPHIFAKILRNGKNLDAVSLAIILANIVLVIPIVYAGVTFDVQEKNLTDNDATTSNARITGQSSNVDHVRTLVANGSNVYVVGYNHTTGLSCTSTCDVIFMRSTNNGTSFSIPIILGTSTGTVSTDTPEPQVAVGSEGNVYVVWKDGTDIRISASANSGSTFATASALDIGNTAETQAKPQIIANSSGNNVFVGWIDDGVYRFTNSTNNGANFASPVNVGDHGTPTDTSRPRIKIATSDTTAYILTREGSNIVVQRSTDSGKTFVFPTTPSDGIVGTTHTGSGASTSVRAFPTIVANVTGSEVYISWRNNTDILFKRSTDDGTTFAFPTTPSDGDLGNIFSLTTPTFPDIAIGSGGRVFVVWEDDTGTDTIKIRNSTDSGATFASEVSLSSNAARSSRIAAADDFVYVAWRDTGATQDITFRSSSNNGTSFGSALTLSGSSHDITPQLAAVNDKVYILWESHPSTITNTGGELNFTAATGDPITVNFNASNYRLTETAEITVEDADSSSSITGTVTSDTDSSGITISLSETGSGTGIFTNTITFTSGSGSSSSSVSRILNVTTGDAITGTFGGVSGGASIFSRIVAFDSSGYNLADIAHITVTDQNSNLISSIETIDVTITATNTGDTSTLTLSETSGTSGVFGGSTSATNNLIIMNGDYEFPTSGTVTITAGTSTVDVTSTSDSSGISGLTLTETSPGSEIFTGTLTLGSSTSGTTIEVAACDTVTVTSVGGLGLAANGFITPCSDTAKDAIKVSVTSSTTDTLTASFEGSTDQEAVTLAGGESGGGGGGVVRPGLVLDVIASLPSGSSGGGGSVPVVSLKSLLKANFIDIPDEIEQVVINFDPFTPLEPFDVTAEQFETFDFPLSIDNDGYALAGYSNTLDTKTLYTGEAIKIKTVFYMPFELEHVAFYINIGEGDTLEDSDTFLRFYKSKPDQFQIKDENGFFEYIDLTIKEVGNKKTVTFDMKFLKPMPKSDIVLRMWDKKLHSTTVLIFDALEVVQGSGILDTQDESGATTSSEESESLSKVREELNESKSIPAWIKTSAGWWSEKRINDSDFVLGIEFLIQNDVIKILPTESETSSSPHIPDWINLSAGWWANDQISDEEFTQALQWLIVNGVMTI